MDPVLAVVIAAVLGVLGLMWLIGSLYRRVGPNRALIVYGFGGMRITTGGGKIVWPLFQSYEELSLELMSFDVAPEQDLYTAQGVAVTVEQIVKEPEMVAGRVRQTVADDLNKMGLEVVSFTIKKVMDDKDYINNMGRPDVARIRREADIAQAEAERDTAIKRAMALREAAIAQAAADQERVIAQTASETRQAEAVRDLEVKKADYEAAVNAQKAIAEKAYEIAANQQQQQVVAEQVRIEQVQRQEQIKVQELEVQRRERELAATVQKAAEAEQRRIQILAEAARQKLAIEALGQAEAVRQQGAAQAEVTRLTGTAESEIIRAKGQAEADAMHLKADAYLQYNQAAILDKYLASMPEVARAMSQALGGVDKVTVVSTGANADGVSSLTAQVAKMIAQVPELFETLTGIKVGDLLGRLHEIDPAAVKPTANGAARDPIDIPVVTTTPEDKP